MTVVPALAALALGRAPDNDGLLGNARCDWQGVETLGEEALLALFAAQPFEPGERETSVVAAQGAAWLGESGALFADLYDGRIARLWRIGTGDHGMAEPAVDVAFDPDMSQVRGGVHFASEDHPELTAGAAESLVVAARSALQALQAQGALRARAFVIRAFGNDQQAAALLGVYTLARAEPRHAGFSLAAVAVTAGQEPLIVIDPPASRAWTPRLR